ncbi:transposable element Tcb2 transposase [Trichonephila clavipes]|nr:transposable element Tcb2 transposase [Trichonephila clavipes]
MGEDYRIREGGFSNRSSCAAQQFHRDASLEAVDQRAPNNSKNWHWMTEGDDPPSRQTVDGCVCNGLMSTELNKLIHTKLSFQMNHASICGSMMAAFVLDAMPVNAAFLERSNLLRIEGNLNSNKYVREVLQPEVVPFLQGSPGAIFQQHNARPHVAKTVRDFCSAQHMQHLPCPAYSPDMSPIEYVWDLVGRRLARDPGPAASKDELLLRIQAIWNSLSQADIQNLFDSMSRRIAVNIAARYGYTKY